MATQVYFPAETVLHERSFVVWPANTVEYEWGGRRLLNLVRLDVAAIARAILAFEAVTVIVSPNDYSSARKILDDSRFDFLQLLVDDLWARDTLPAFTLDSAGQRVSGVDFNFNGWGNKVENLRDRTLAKRFLVAVTIPLVSSTLVTEPGALEQDGEGTLLVTESSILNQNRNPGWSKNSVEVELKRVLGVKKIVWFKGVKGKDITDAHIDAFVRFVRPGRVIVSRPCRQCRKYKDDYVWAKASDEALEVLKKETDARGEKFEIVEIYEPNPDKVKVVGYADTFLASYVNFYIVNGGVILAKFGDQEADTAAVEVLQKEFPDRKIVPVEISALASGGGGIHCATHDLPATSGSPRLP